MQTNKIVILTILAGLAAQPAFCHTPGVTPQGFYEKIFAQLRNSLHCVLADLRPGFSETWHSTLHNSAKTSNWLYAEKSSLSSEIFGDLFDGNFTFLCGPTVDHAIVDCGSFHADIDLTVSGGGTPYSYRWSDMPAEAIWNFENNTNDVSGNGHNRTGGSGSFTTFDNVNRVEGQYAFNFNGSTYLRYGIDGGFLETAYSARTYSLWINPANLTGIKVLFDQGGSTAGMAARLNGNILTAALRTSGATSQRTTGNLTFPNDGAWHHVAVVFNNGNLTCYLDGVASTTVTAEVSTMPANGNNDGLGGRNGSDAFAHGSTNFYSGRMDDVRLFYSALTPDQIADIARNDGDRTDLAAGNYSVTVSNATGCTTTQNVTVVTPCIVLEICNNGLDDDGDGLVDCADPDCAEASPSCPGECLGANLSFESDLTGWTTYSGLVTATTAEARTGTKSAYFGNTSGYLFQNISTGISPLTPYVLSFWVKGTANAGANRRMALKFRDAEGYELTRLEIPTEDHAGWTRYTRVFTLPQGTASIELSFSVSATSIQYYLDDVCLNPSPGVLPTPSCTGCFAWSGTQQDASRWWLHNGTGWISYGYDQDIRLCHNGDGTITIQGNAVMPRSEDGIPCGETGGWYMNVTLSDKKTWAQWNGNWDNFGQLNHGCPDFHTEWEYWDITGTITGTGCNTGKVFPILGNQPGYRIQVGTGANRNDCGFGLAGWVQYDDNGTTRQADIYLMLGKDCYSAIEICHNGLDDDGDGFADCNDPDCYRESHAEMHVGDLGDTGGWAIRGQPDGLFARIYDLTDRLKVDLARHLNVGYPYTITWRRKSTYANTAAARMVVEESLNGITWTAHPVQPATSEKNNFIQTTLQANVPVRYLRFSQVANTDDDYDLDAITVAGCPVEICGNGLDDDGDGFIDCNCNLVANGEFDSGLTGWELYVQGGNTATVSVDNSGQLSGANSGLVNITTASGTDWHIQAVYPGLSIEAGKKYQVSFRARAAANRPASVWLQMQSYPYTSYWNQNINLTTAPQTFTFEAPVSVTVHNDIGLYFNLGESTANVWIDAVSFSEICEAPPAVTSCPAGILQNPGFEGGMANWSANGGGGTVATGGANGGQAAQVTAPNAGIYQNFPVVPGEVFRLSFFAKQTGTLAWGGVGIIWFDAAWNKIDEVAFSNSQFSSNWHLFEVMDDAPTGAAHGQAYAYRTTGAGTLLVDEFCLQKMTSAAAGQCGGIFNSGFELGKAGWQGDLAKVELSPDAYTGSQAARLTGTFTALSREIAPVVPGQLYELTFYTKRLGSAGWSEANLIWYNDNYNNLGQQSIGISSALPEYRLKKITSIAPPGATKLSVSFHKSSGSDVLIDDVCLEVGNPSAHCDCSDNLFVNGGFETRTAAVTFPQVLEGNPAQKIVGGDKDKVPNWEGSGGPGNNFWYYVDNRSGAVNNPEGDFFSWLPGDFCQSSVLGLNAFGLEDGVEYEVCFYAAPWNISLNASGNPTGATAVQANAWLQIEIGSPSNPSFNSWARWDLYASPSWNALNWQRATYRFVYRAADPLWSMVLTNISGHGVAIDGVSVTRVDCAADCPLVSNSGFENGLAGWEKWGANTASVAQPYAGSFAARVRQSGYVARYLPINPGKNHHLSFWAKREGSAGWAEFGYKFYNSNSEEIPGTEQSFQLTNPAWTNYEVPLTNIPVNALYLNIWFSVAGTSSDVLLIDEVCLAIDGPSPEICDNGLDDDGDGLIDANDPDCITFCNAGFLTLERWTGINGTSIANLTSDVNYPNNPSFSGTLTNFESPKNVAENYGTRVRGYIAPTVTGTYSFNMTGDDASALYLSTGASASNKVLIASFNDYTGVTEHTKFPSQTSANITLTAGQKYYVELLHKEGVGGDHFQVYWKTPLSSTWTIVPGENLFPFICPTEICNNGIDDDGDGLTDCLDPDCGQIMNREFDEGTTNWNLYQSGGGTASFTVDNTSQLSGANSARVNVTATSGADWNIQFVQTGKTLVAGKNYTFTFQAKAATNRQMTAAVDLGISPWNNYFSQVVNLTTSPQTFTYTFLATATQTNTIRAIFKLGAATGTVWIDNVQLTEVCPNPEICGNNLDDDSDGLADCEDPDCLDLPQVPASPTYRTIANGDWGNSSIWAGGSSPNVDIGGGATVVIEHEVVCNSDIKILGGSQVYVVQGHLTLPGKNLIVENGGIYLVGSEFIQPSSGNLQLTNGSAYFKAVNSKVQVGQNFQNSNGTSILKNVCLTVGEKYDKSGGVDSLINVCATIGLGTSGNFANNSGFMYLANSEFNLPNGNFVNQSGGTVAGEHLVIRIGSGNLDNAGNWTASVLEYCVSGSVNVPSAYLPASQNCSTIMDYFYPCDCGCSGLPTEICNNGIDDDGDGLIDVIDPDCANFCDAGSLTIERWAGINGTAIANLTNHANYPDNPSFSGRLTSFGSPNDIADNYGTRVRGYIVPTVTGTYSFNVTGDDASALYLSTGASAANSVLIASFNDYTGVTEHTKFPSQTSADITLTAGQKYYVELLHKEGTGGDHFQVYWKTPSSSTWTIVPGANLFPFCPFEICGNGIDDDGDGLTDQFDPDCNACAGDNMGFEAGLTGWNHFNAITTNDAYVGSTAALLAENTTLSKVIAPIQPDTTYLVSFYTKASGTPTAMYASIHFLNSSGTVIGHLTRSPKLSTGWELHTLVFTAPAGAANLRIDFSAYGTGVSLKIDEICLKTIPGYLPPTTCNGCEVTPSYEDLGSHFSMNYADGWVGWDVDKGTVICHNPDGSINIQGNMVNPVSGFGTPCGPTDGWFANITLSNKKSWAQFGGSYDNASTTTLGCTDNHTQWDYWDVSGVLIGQGCNAGQTATITGNAPGYHVQVGMGANRFSCGFGMAGWLEYNLGGTIRSMDIYFVMDENCYEPPVEICNNGIDDDGDGLADCADPDCDRITLNTPVVSSCIDHPLQDVATVSVQVSWTNAPPNDTIEVSIYGQTERINTAGGATSPQTITFTVPANGSVGNGLTARWRNAALCSKSTTYNVPAACSANEVGCDILYLCGLDKPYDGDGWDHGWIVYLDEVNGANLVTPVLTKPDGSGFGMYDPMNPSVPVAVNLDDYGLVVISATTEGHVANGLVDLLKNFTGSVLSGNYTLINDLGLSASEGTYHFRSDLYVDDSDLRMIYNYNNDLSPYYPKVFTKGDYTAAADGYLWTSPGSQTARTNGVYFVYETADPLSGIAGVHGRRVYLGYHMNGLYANAENGGALPAPVENWFIPATHLTLDGKYWLDQAILEATKNCKPEICNNGIDDNDNGLVDCADLDCQPNGFLEAVYDSYKVCPGSSFTEQVIFNDLNLKNPIFTIASSTSQGAVTINNSSGVFTYTPNGFGCTNDQFVYQVCNQTTGCCDTAAVYLIIQDTLSPLLANVPPDITISCESEIPAPPLVYGLNTCPGVYLSFDEVSTQGNPGTCQHYTITRTWQVTDLCGNTSDSSQVITVEDNTPPELFRLYTLANGKKVVAGVSSQSTHQWKKVRFPVVFNFLPIVFTQVVSENENDAVTVRQRNLTTSGFDLRLQEQESSTGAHLAEQVAWIALEPGSLDDLTNLQAGTLTNVTHLVQSLTFGEPFLGPPIFLAAMQTANDLDPATVRLQTIVANQVQVFIEEEKSSNVEVLHANENVGYLALHPGTLHDADSSFVAKAGMAVLSEQWTTVHFDRKYTKPVVVFGAIPNNDGIPATVRVRNVQSDRFEARIQHWDYLGPQIVGMTLPYLVTEGSVPAMSETYCSPDAVSLLPGVNLFVTDNCDSQVELNYEDDAIVGVYGLRIDLRWTAQDDCGNLMEVAILDTCAIASARLIAFLAGPLLSNGGNELMQDDLRKKGYLPLQEPFTGMTGFLHKGKGGGETVSLERLEVEGPEAIVDWLFVEVRDSIEAGKVLATRSVLLQRNGYVIAADGSPFISFDELLEGEYYLSIRHRNHLGTMAAGRVYLRPNAPLVDFKEINQAVFGGTQAGKLMPDGRRSLWPGDMNGDRRVVFQGPGNDIFELFSKVLSSPDNVSFLANYILTGYHRADINLDGNVIFQGPNNDRSLLLYQTVLEHPDNSSFLANFIVLEKLP